MQGKAVLASFSPPHAVFIKYLPAGRSRFTISSARSNNANPVLVLTTVHSQHPAVQENMQSSRDAINMGNRLSLQNREKKFHLSKLLNLVAYLIRKTHKITKKSPAPKADHIKSISYL